MLDPLGPLVYLMLVASRDGTSVDMVFGRVLEEGAWGFIFHLVFKEGLDLSHFWASFYVTGTRFCQNMHC